MTDEKKELPKIEVIEKTMKLGTHVDHGLLANMNKTVEEEKNLPGRKKKKFTKNKIRLTSPYDDASIHEGAINKDGYRISDRDLRGMSIYDPYISAIISTRVSQVANIMNQSESKFDKGIRVVDVDPPKKEDFNNDAEYEKEADRRKQQMDSIMRFALNCGTTNKDVLDLVYSEGDRDFKHTSLQRWAQSQTRNLLTFGRMATQKMFAPDGELALFRPAPVESIKPIDPKRSIFISRDRETAEQSIIDAEEWNELPEDAKPAAYVQEIDGKQVGFFTSQDMSVKYYQDQCLIDLNGYPLAPIELSVYMVFVHQQTLEYLKNQFTKGMLSKSIIVINSTDPAIDVNPKDLQNFKKELQNFALRTDNSAAIPVISGPVEITPVTLTQGMHDMEWLQVEQAIIRSLCSSFQIDPSEIGQGIVNETATMSQGGKDTELIHSQERGLRILVDVLMEELNEVAIQRFPEMEGKYKIVATGIGSENYDGFLQRSISELQTTATLNDLFAQSEKNREPFHISGDVPLNPLWHANVKGALTFGELREYFYGDEGATKNPDFKFFLDPTIQQSYMQTKMMSQQAQAPQNGAPPQPQSLQQAVGDQGNAQPVQKSDSAPMPLSESVQKSEKLEKSGFLSEWIRLHK